MIGRLCSEETLNPNGKGGCRSGQGLFTEDGGAQECTGIRSSGQGRKELLAEPWGSPRAGRAKGVTGQDRGVWAEQAGPRTAVTEVSRSPALLCGEKLALLWVKYSCSCSLMSAVFTSEIITFKACSSTVLKWPFTYGREVTAQATAVIPFCAVA